MINNGSISYGVEKVTPERAELWLARNRDNRNLRRSRVASLARDMAGGRWQLNGDAIRFSRSGVLVDGQHRLAAVIESQCTIESLVIRGVDDEARFTIDVGAPRTAADGLRFQGVENAKYVAPLARRLVQWRVGARSLGGSLNATHPEIYDFVAEHPQIHAAASVALRARTSVPCSPTSVGVAYYLAAERSRDDAEVFFIDQMIEKIGLRADDPARVLLKRLDAASAGDRKERARRIHEDDALRYIIIAWNAFRGRKRLTKLQAPRGGWGGTYPEPR